MRVLTADGDAIKAAGALLRSGGIVAFPTETVYGLGADAWSRSAVEKIYEMKGRPAWHPLIVHAADAEAAFAVTSGPTPTALRIAEAFWPGPITMILARSGQFPSYATGGEDTIAIRVPGHDVARAVISESGTVLAAPSANRFGAVSPTTAQHVLDSLGDQDALLLDGGPCRVGVESTIIDVRDSCTVLRHGGVTIEMLRDVVGDVSDTTNTSPTRAPGRLRSHYAPEAQLELVATGHLDNRAKQLHESGVDLRVVKIAASMSLEDYAHDLYSQLREADSCQAELILAELPPLEGLGRAIYERLTKAAAPRQ